jgi:hypothetical protein
MDILPMLAQVVKFLDITLGNIITLSTLAGAFLMGWQRLRDQIQTLEKRMENVEAAIQSISEHGVPSMCLMHASRMDAFEKKMEIVSSMATDVEWIKNTLASVTHKLDNERRRNA